MAVKMVRNKAEKEAKKVAPKTSEEYLVAELTDFRKEHEAALKKYEGSALTYQINMNGLIRAYAMKGEDFGDRRAVVGYKRVVKVMMGEDIDKVAKGRG